MEETGAVVFELKQEKKTSKRAELVAKKLRYFAWLDTPKDFRKPQQVKEVEKFLSVSHPTFVAWGKEYRAQVKVGQRIKSQIEPKDIAGYLVEKLEMSQRLLNQSAATPEEQVKDTTEALAWVTLGNVLSRLNKQLQLCCSPLELTAIAGKITAVVREIEEMAASRAPMLRREATRVSAQNRYGASLSGIVLPGSGPVGIVPPAQPKAIEAGVVEPSGEEEELARVEEEGPKATESLPRQAVEDGEGAEAGESMGPGKEEGPEGEEPVRDENSPMVMRGWGEDSFDESLDPLPKPKVSRVPR